MQRYFGGKYVAPFEEIVSNKDLRKAIARGSKLEVHPKCPQSCKELMHAVSMWKLQTHFRKCWELEYLRRPSFEEIVGKMETIRHSIDSA